MEKYLVGKYLVEKYLVGGKKKERTVMVGLTSLGGHACAHLKFNKLLRSIKNAMTIPSTASLSFLPRSDGSASFSQGRTSVIASVNGPMEVRIRDELPQEAYIEVIVRPAIGVTSMASPPFSTHPRC